MPDANNSTREVILEKARLSLEERYGHKQYRFNLRARWIPGSLLNTSSENILSVKPAGPIKRDTIFEVIYESRSQKESIEVQLIVEGEYKIPVAKNRIASGGTLEADQFEMNWIPVSFNRGELVESLEGLEGKTLRRTLTDGQPVRQADVTSAYLVRAGETVTIIYNENGIQLGLKGEARENGSLGDEIKIFSKETRKRYVGKVQSPGTVIWHQTL